MNRSPLTEQYQRVMSLVEQLRELPEDERNFILDLLVPLPEQPEVKKATKRASKKSNKPASKSARASGMAAAIKGSLDQQREAVRPDPACVYIFPDETPCKRIEDNPVHRKDGGYAGYHEFQSAGESLAANGD